MDNKLEETVFKNAVDFCRIEIIEPVLEQAQDWVDIDSFDIFTPELSELFSYNLPSYFATDYKQFIGEYFCFTLYGDALTIEMLKDIVIEEGNNVTPEEDEDSLEESEKSWEDYINPPNSERSKFEGLRVYFSSEHESLKVDIEQNSIRETRFYFDHVMDVIILKTIEYLNLNNRP